MNESKMEMLLSAQTILNLQRRSGDNLSNIIILTNMGLIECELDHRLKASEIQDDKAYTLTQLAFSINDDPGVNQVEETKINKDCVLLKNAMVHSFSSSKDCNLGSVCLSLDAVQGVSIGRMSSPLPQRG